MMQHLKNTCPVLVKLEGVNMNTLGHKCACMAASSSPFQMSPRGNVNKQSKEIDKFARDRNQLIFSVLSPAQSQSYVFQYRNLFVPFDAARRTHSVVYTVTC